jgi:UDP-glucose 4-epimerase
VGISVLKKAVITGGAGFIGSNLADTLVADGFEVTIVDNFSTGNHAFLGKHDYQIVDCDIRHDSQQLTSAITN